MAEGVQDMKRALVLGLFAMLTGPSVLLAEEVLEFEMADVYGRIVSSQDYKGVPVFLEFGACW